MSPAPTEYKQLLDKQTDEAMNITADQITADNLSLRLKERLTPTQLNVVDESRLHNGHIGANGTGFGTHFRVRIASPFFTNKSRVACHRLVYDAVQDFIDAGLHALAIEVIPPTQEYTQQ